ncbi:MAG: YihY/virulence factor BrkB family protein [Gemmatimonadota bacterium]|nr:YihY/virulence factor BrkB family protein [Gemmatimonadota bacterium]
MKPSKTFLAQVAHEFVEDQCPRLAAAISYYTIFSLPALLVVALAVAGLAVERQAVVELLSGEIGKLLGTQAVDQLQAMIDAGLRRPREGNLLGAALGIGAFLFAATGAFVQIQGALNTVWGVAPSASGLPVRHFLVKRLLSFGMILVVGLLILLLLGLSTLVTLLGDRIGSFVPGSVEPLLSSVGPIGVTWVTATLLFMVVYRLLPDAEIRWSVTLVGAAVTGALFTLGEQLMGHYLIRFAPADAFGAAGSLALFLFWIYVSAIAFLLGAEITQVWASRRGTPIRPEEGAVKIIVSKETLDSPTAT